MKIVMKKQISLFLAAATLFSLAGCGSGGDKTASEPADMPPTGITPLAAAVSGNASAVLADASLEAAGAVFADVSPDAAYARAVGWCYEHNLMNGVGDDRFDPNGALTRSMMATVLYRAKGEPAVSGDMPFTDAQTGAWYSNALIWAGSTGIMQGYGSNAFGVDDPVSVEQLEVIMGRYTGGGPAWQGDPGKAHAATRAEVAAALYGSLSNANDGFVKIDGGTFTMGSPSEEAEREDDETPHDVTVSGFYMSPAEVTQKEYQAIVNGNPSERQGENLPVTNVSWYDAVRYCNALSEANGFTKAYDINGTTVTWNRAADGYRLPTEAEWEYAARANTRTPFSFGDYVHDEDANCYNAYGYHNNASGSWVNGYLEHTVEVKSYPANANGLYEIHGNAAEWVWDWYGAYGTASICDPMGPEAGNYKVARGGAWNDFPKHIRSAYRSANAPDVGTYGIGIRPVRGAVGEGTVTSSFRAVEQKSSKKVLIAYFSQTGNTKGLTDIIAGMTGADVFRIERSTAYSSTHNSQGLYAEALDELRSVAVPDLKTSLEAAGYKIDEYDTILLGYCNWWASIPAPVRSFLKKYDLSGKTIIPYCSMGGGRFGQTISAVAKLAPDSNIKAGLDTVYSSYDRERIQKWLDASLKEAGSQSSDEKDTSTVFMTADISPDGLSAVYAALEARPAGKTAVKLSTGEDGSNYLRADLIGDFVKSLNATIVECNTAYGGSRANTAMHKQLAADHGYTAIAKVDIMDENGSMTLPVTGGDNLTENYVGSHFKNYDYYVILSHFKGHAMAGYGGAIKNISIGIASSQGKSHIHTGGKGGSMWSAGQDSFLESMAEAGKSVVDYLDGNILYINVMNRLSVDCDCDGSPAQPDMHDIGILASYDPVALDQACVDLVYAAEDGKSLVRRIESRNGIHTLEQAEKIGLGSRRYKLVSLDNKEEKPTVNKLKVSFNGHTYSAALAGNSSADAFIQYIRDCGGSVTISAHDYGSFEKVGPLGATITSNNEQIVTVPGDIILYQGNNVCLYYATNSWNFTRLGKLEGDLSNLKTHLGGGDVSITYSIP